MVKKYKNTDYDFINNKNDLNALGVDESFVISYKKIFQNNKPNNQAILKKNNPKYQRALIEVPLKDKKVLLIDSYNSELNNISYNNILLPWEWWRLPNIKELMQINKKWYSRILNFIEDQDKKEKKKYYWSSTYSEGWQKVIYMWWDYVFTSSLQNKFNARLVKEFEK